MTIDTKTIVSVTEANQNFSRVTRIAEKNGQAVIFKNNKPKYMLVDLDVSPMIDMTDDDSAVRSSLSFMLKRAGYEVKTAPGPREAMDIVRAESPALILMDMNFTLSIRNLKCYC